MATIAHRIQKLIELANIKLGQVATHVLDNTANICPLSVLDIPLQSEIDWVRKQALSIIAGLNLTRWNVDVDLRKELVIDLTNSRLLR